MSTGWRVAPTARESRPPMRHQRTRHPGEPCTYPRHSCTIRRIRPPRWRMPSGEARGVGFIESPPVRATATEGQCDGAWPAAAIARRIRVAGRGEWSRRDLLLEHHSTGCRDADTVSVLHRDPVCLLHPEGRAVRGADDHRAPARADAPEHRSGNADRRRAPERGLRTPSNLLSSNPRPSEVSQCRSRCATCVRSAVAASSPTALRTSAATSAPSARTARRRCRTSARTAAGSS